MHKCFAIIDPIKVFAINFLYKSKIKFLFVADNIDIKNDFCKIHNLYLSHYQHGFNIPAGLTTLILHYLSI